MALFTLTIRESVVSAAMAVFGSFVTLRLLGTIDWGWGVVSIPLIMVAVLVASWWLDSLILRPILAGKTLFMALPVLVGCVVTAEAVGIVDWGWGKTALFSLIAIIGWVTLLDAMGTQNHSGTAARDTS